MRVRIKLQEDALNGSISLVRQMELGKINLVELSKRFGSLFTDGIREAPDLLHIRVKLFNIKVRFERRVSGSASIIKRGSRDSIL